MATHRIPIMGPNTVPDTTGTVFVDNVGNQITATNEVGNQNCLVVTDHSADNGFYGDFGTPQNYASAPKIVVSGIFDGAPGAGEDLGFTFQGLTLAVNEAADQAYGTEDTVQDTDIGSTGTNYSDEDYFEFSITLSNLTPVAGERIFYFFARDDASTTYTGRLLILGLEFEYSD